jgi:IS30 family transposase
MSKNFEQLTAEERATIMVMAQEGKSLRAMARTLHRAPSTISREWRRHELPRMLRARPWLRAKRAGQRRDAAAFQPRRARKLAVEGVLFGVVDAFSARGLVARTDCRHYENAVA